MYFSTLEQLLIDASLASVTRETVDAAEASDDVEARVEAMARAVQRNFVATEQQGRTLLRLTVEGGGKDRLAGQTATDENGQPRYAGDMGAQLGAALDNVEAVLHAGGYALGDLVRLNYYTTDIPAFFAGYGAITRRLEAAGGLPSGTLLGVSRLARPELLVEIEGTAVR